MSTPLHSNVTGSFTSDGLLRQISIPSGYNKFEMYNITDLGSTAANTNVMVALATSLMPADSGIYTPKTSGAATLGTSVTTLTGGFTFISDSATLANSASVATTAMTNASPPVFSTATTTGLVDGSTVVRIFNNAGAQQISSMDFTVGAVSAGVSFALKYMGAPGSVGTTGAYRIINAQSRYYPRRRFVTAITLASSAVITLSVTHQFTVGQAVRIIVPAAFGMTQMNGLIGNITAINTTTNTITVDINSSAFSTFAFPTSAIAAAGVDFAQVVPVGEAAINSVSQPYGNLLDDATDNVSFSGIQIGATVQTTGKLYQWIATNGVTI